MNKKGLLVLFSAFLISLVLMTAGCVDQDDTQNSITASYADAGSEKVDVVRLSGGDYGYPQPFSIYPRGPGSSKVGMIFDSLVERDEVGIIPWLAKSWEINADGTEYTFYLREGVSWNDGEPFTANDIKFTFEYEQEYVPIAGGMETGVVDSVQVVDENTVKFVLTQPVCTFLYKMTGFKIIPQHIYEDVTDPASFLDPEAVTGTGPFLLEEYNQEHGTYRFVMNENFWDRKHLLKPLNSSLSVMR